MTSLCIKILYPRSTSLLQKALITKLHIIQNDFRAIAQTCVRRLYTLYTIGTEVPQNYNKRIRNRVKVASQRMNMFTRKLHIYDLRLIRSRQLYMIWSQIKQRNVFLFREV